MSKPSDNYAERTLENFRDTHQMLLDQPTPEVYSGMLIDNYIVKQPSLDGEPYNFLVILERQIDAITSHHDLTYTNDSVWVDAIREKLVHDARG